MDLTQNPAASTRGSCSESIAPSPVVWPESSILLPRSAQTAISSLAHPHSASDFSQARQTSAPLRHRRTQEESSLKLPSQPLPKRPLHQPPKQLPRLPPQPPFQPSPKSTPQSPLQLSPLRHLQFTNTMTLPHQVTTHLHLKLTAFLILREACSSHPAKLGRCLCCAS